VEIGHLNGHLQIGQVPQGEDGFAGADQIPRFHLLFQHGAAEGGLEAGEGEALLSFPQQRSLRRHPLLSRRHPLLPGPQLFLGCLKGLLGGA
jgi:hypothetical protein